ncbi:hypothetical protein H311_04519, partial [Anncaliia algerae PRA109]
NIIKEAKSSCLLQDNENIVICTLNLEEKSEIDDFIEVNISEINSENRFVNLQNIMKEGIKSLFTNNLLKTKLKFTLFIFEGLNSFEFIANSISICLLQSGLEMDDWLIGINAFNSSIIYKVISNEIVYLESENFNLNYDGFLKQVNCKKEIIKNNLMNTL